MKIDRNNLLKGKTKKAQKILFENKAVKDVNKKNKKVRIVMMFKYFKCLLFLSAMLPRIGAVNKRSKEPIVNDRLYQISGTPLSITSHWEKYKKKTITTIEFAKS